jgi:hypothetical protein
MHTQETPDKVAFASRTAKSLPEPEMQFTEGAVSATLLERVVA